MWRCVAEQVDVAVAQPSHTANVTYGAGPISARFDVTSWTRQGDATVTANTNKNRFRVSGNYDLGMAKIGLGYSSLKHLGIHHYTIGQRRGIGIAAPEPLYVVALNPGKNQVVVGSRAETHGLECTVDRVNWVSIPQPTTPIRAEVQIRYRSEAVPVSVIPLAGNKIKLVFDEPQFGITPGQAAVWYDGDIVLGGGIIDPIV